MSRKTLRRINLSLLLVLLSVLFFGSRHYPLITRIEVSGAGHFSPQAAAELAGVAYGEPLLWVSKASVRGLLDEPRVAALGVERRLPGTVRLNLLERRAVVTDGELSYALDGVSLGPATEPELTSLPRLSGWGTPRLDEALDLLILLADFKPEMISYTPAGFNVQLAESKVFTPTVNALRTHWASFVSQQGTQAHVYPWGVSARYE